ncbi:MAG: HlyD family secretion protein [Oceanococcus sp.]|nr:MAG: HlyD family secretion protein [Oceanococcus sp.]
MPTTQLPFGLSKNLAALIIAVLTVVLVSLLVVTKPDAQVNPPQEPVYTVRAITVEPAPRRPSLLLYGTAESPARARMTAAVAADVLAVHALAGDHRPHGELLIELDPAEADIALSQARAQLAQAEAQLALDAEQRRSNKAALEHEQALLSLAERAVARAVRLRQQGVLSEAELDSTKQNYQRQKIALEQRRLAVQQADAVTRQLKAQVASAEAQLRRAELDLQRTQIVAPFDAAVVQTHVAPGDRVTPGQPLIDVYDQSRVEIRAQVPNRYVPALKQALQQGQLIRAQVLSAGQRLPAQFLRLAASAGGGGQNAFFRVAGAAVAVDANVSLELDLPPQAQAVAVPFTALYDLSRVFRVRDDGRLESLTVENLGDFHSPKDELSSPPQLLVRSADIQAGDRIITTQLPNAISGLKVQVISDE